ncbi:MAG: hypothetical protein ACOZEN_12450 [Thermodesulfobacteriota bacterium]
MLRAALILGSLLVLVCALGARASSEKAASLREANSLVPYTPPEAFLSGNFLADEMEPSLLFGTVKDFVSSRKCAVSWLMEQGEKARIARPSESGSPLEYTLYLEEDCPGGVTYYVFVDQSAMTPKQWIEWRKQFHKNKAEGEYGATRDRLEKAVDEGMKVSGELRFIIKDGELFCGKPPEAVLTQDMAFKPCYDLKQGVRLSN